MLRSTEWLVAAAVLVLGVALAGVAMYGVGLSLLWEGFGTRGEETTRPWWLWLLLLLPPVLMLLVGLLVRRSGASMPLACGGAGLTGAMVGIGYLATIYLTNH